jgi:hypothetical protein
MSIWSSIGIESGERKVDVATATSWNQQVRIWIEDESGEAEVVLEIAEVRDLIARLHQAIDRIE